jgi:hypothetical protein
MKAEVQPLRYMAPPPKESEESEVEKGYCARSSGIGPSEPNLSVIKVEASHSRQKQRETHSRGLKGF